MNLKDIFKIVKKLKEYILNWRNHINQYSYLESLFKNVKREEILNKTVVFNTIKKVKDFIDLEFYMAKLLCLNGAKVIILLDDGILKHWEGEAIKNYSSYHRNYKRIFYLLFFEYLIRKAIKSFQDKNLEILYYSKIVSKINQDDWRSLKKFALSSTIRKYRTSVLNLREPDVSQFFKLSIKNALISRNIGEFIFEKIKPDYFVTSHGIYSIWGPAFNFLNSKGIKSLVYARIHNHSMNPQDSYLTTTLGQTLTKCRFWQDFKTTKVSEEMRIRVQEWIDSRVNHNLKDTIVYYEKNLKKLDVNKNDGYKFHIAIFPSLIWDGDIQERHVVFDGVLDWLISTLDHLKNKKTIKIFLKFHPAEVTSFKNSAKIQDLIWDYLEKNKIKNLEIIPSDYKIDPYNFLKSGIDLGICYDGVLGLEMPLLKIPVIMGGNTGRFTIENGNYTIRNKEEYLHYLDNIDSLIEDFQENYDKYITNIIRYTYWYIYENVFTLPTMPLTYRGKSNLFKIDKKDLHLEKNLLKAFSF